MAEEYHIPVLLKESVDGLTVRPHGVYVDVTFGGGGHSREILRRLGGTGKLFSFDQDADAEQNIRNDQLFQQAQDRGTFTFVRSNFRYLKNWMHYYGIEQIDGLLADLGVSSHHFDDESRGFSFRFQGPLDMRMNKRAGLTAADVVNNYDEGVLSDLFLYYGELKQARRIAKAIASMREQKAITTTEMLTAVVEPLLKKEREKKELAKLFQALRIEVNQEMTALRELLLGATEMLRIGGRLSVITYHSLEDRLVKNVIKSGNLEGKVVQDLYGRIDTPFKAVGKMIVPDEMEQQANPRSRSAKLRVAERIEG